MSISKQESEGLLKSLAVEIEGHERAISGWKADLDVAKENEDDQEAQRLQRQIKKSEKTISVAKDQIQILSGSAQTAQRRSAKR